MKVYRLEQVSTGQGPWHVIGDLSPEAAYDLGRASRHPSPVDEGLKLDSVAICAHGCTSIEQLRQWFTLELWLSEDFNIVVYEVSSTQCRLTGLQAMFNPEHADIVDTFETLSDLRLGVPLGAA